MSAEPVIPARFSYDESDGGVWRIQVELSPGRVVFLSLHDAVASLKGQRSVTCRVSATAQPETLRLEILDETGRRLGEKEIFAPRTRSRGAGPFASV
jgi:hypothetical protein